MSAAQPVLELTDLRVRTTRGDDIIEAVDFELAAGEILGIVGESGSGKTTTALSVLGYSDEGIEVASGRLSVAGERLRPDESMRGARGRLVSYVPQDPGRSLNPSMRIARAIEDMIAAHRRGDEDAVARARAALATVGLPDEDGFARRYPHELSGGQQQRVCIGKSLATEPTVIVLDEPTTGLDVVTQARILAELSRLRDERGLSMIYVTHDLAVVAQVADRIAVMYAGRIVEEGPAREVLRRPSHPYTRGLLASIPDHVAPRALEPMPGIALGIGDRPEGCRFAPRCPQASDECRSAVPALAAARGGVRVRCVHWARTPALDATPPPSRTDAPEAGAPVLTVEGLSAEHRGRDGVVVAARDVSFVLNRGGCLALVGESGSGKTTIARAIAGLHPIAGGRVRLGDQTLPSLARRRTVEQRRRVQLVFQNATAALNPRHSVRAAIGRPARVLRGLRGAALDAEVDRLLECVRLPANAADRYPAELSGGERQRVAIARALAAEPDVILCDEITSALDVSVQAAVLKLLVDLRRDLGVSLLFITHDLGVVATIADEVMVLEDGSVCERGPTGRVLGAPEHAYTRQLLAAAPSVAAAVALWDAAVS